MHRQFNEQEANLPASDAAWRARCQEHFGLPGEVDLVHLAAQQASISGAFGVYLLSRAVSGLPAQRLVRVRGDIDPDGQGVVWFELQGKRQTGRRDSVLLKVQGVLTLTCQRCMQSMRFAVDEQVAFELFETEAQLDRAGVDEQFESDTPEPLVVDRPVSLVSLIEDQIILALPYVPKHLQCQSNPAAGAQHDSETKRESPFQVLEKLKQGKSD